VVPRGGEEGRESGAAVAGSSASSQVLWGSAHMSSGSGERAEGAGRGRKRMDLPVRSWVNGCGRVSPMWHAASLLVAGRREQAAVRL